MQEFFLENYKIISIIESKVERWFEEADINTCIIILQKCKDKKERDENLVRFVYLKKRLRDFIPAAQDMWEKQVERLNAIDNFKKTILAHNEFYENKDLRIYPKSQKELWDEGYDATTISSPSFKEGVRGRYIGSKWGKYLRAPEFIVRKILMNSNLCLLNNFAERIMEGEPTGANDFFFLSNDVIKRFKIENGFLKPAFTSPKDSKSITLIKKNSKSKKLVLNLKQEKLKGTNVLKYIKWGKRKGFKKHYFKEDVWYARTDRKADILIPRGIYQRFICFDNKEGFIASDRFVEIFLGSKRKLNTQILALFNSSLYVLMLELYCRTNLGQGALDIQPTDIRKIPVPDLNVLNKKSVKKIEQVIHRLSKDTIDPIFSELGAYLPGEVTLDKVKPDRRELDKIIMGEILGLTEKEQLEVYRTVIDLVKSRIERAKSFGKGKKIKEGVDIDLFIKTIKDKIGDDTLGKFYREKVKKSKVPLRIVHLPAKMDKIRIDSEIFGFRLISGRKHVDCKTGDEAKYLKIFLEAGMEKVKIPKQELHLKQILPELQQIKKRIDRVIESDISTIINVKLRKKLEHLIWQEVMK